MQQKAAARGILQAYRFFDMTPRQVCLCLKAHSAQEKQHISSLHLQAALMTLAFHAPAKLPSLPSFLPADEMPWEEMKQRLLAWRRKDEP